MVDVSIDGNCAVFQVKARDQLWTLGSRLEIPLAHITHATIAEHTAGWWRGMKLGCTDIPGVLAAGTFYFHGDVIFWDVHNPAKAVLVSLAHEHHKRLIIEVADPVLTVERLREAVQSFCASGDEGFKRRSATSA